MVENPKSKDGSMNLTGTIRRHLAESLRFPQYAGLATAARTYVCKKTLENFNIRARHCNNTDGSFTRKMQAYARVMLRTCNITSKTCQHS
ncbi:unnamed protein product [Pieris brassicae]|uniref:Uncharacterized protein n=1 Tax=Pieris brassicae TaxID=7116 RepID=A0A9P0T6G2_PIEBR|nr:unnamed protein product [Pieris brassicae]